jgi:hypothetical protein
MGNTLRRRDWGAFNPVAWLLEEAQVVIHEACEPDVIGDFPDANSLTGKDLAEIDLAAAEA